MSVWKRPSFESRASMHGLIRQLVSMIDLIFDNKSENPKYEHAVNVLRCLFIFFTRVGVEKAFSRIHVEPKVKSARQDRALRGSFP
jgi:hypothetical protein